jgi:iron complex outermembrane receptor protein
MLAGTGLAILALTPAAYAQSASEGIGEVVVTATKAGVTNLQKTPISVSVVGGGDLKESQVVTLKDLPTVVSALKIDTNSQSTIVRIRGIGGGGFGDSDVSIYMDGVYLSRNSIALQSNFNDLDRVEVVKGPQGTLFGRNSVGGALNFISKRPSDTFTMQNTLVVGNYNLIDEAFSISGPLAENFKGSLSAGYVNHAGYIDNIIPGKPDIYTANRSNVRAQLEWQVAPNLVSLTRADYIYTDEAWSTNQTLLVRTDDPRITAASRFSAPLANSTVGDLSKIASDLTPRQREQSYGINNETVWTINDNLSLNNLIAYRTDKSVSFTTANDGTEYYAADSGSQYRQHQFSEEINLVHNFGPLNGVAGLYFFQEYSDQITNSTSAGRNPARTGAGTRLFQDTRQPQISKAAFFSETYHIVPTVGITLGARYTEEVKRWDGINTQWVYDPGAANNGALSTSNATADFPFIRGYGSNKPWLSKKLNALTPKISVDWQITDSAMVYASAAKGFRSGGFANSARKDTPTGTLTPAITTPVKADYGSEKIKAYEVGAKTDWFDKRLRFNIAYFVNDWTDLQVGVLVAPSVAITSNAASARTSGFDIDVTAKPLDGLTLTASATLMPDAKYVDYANASPPSGIILNNILASSPVDPRYKTTGPLGPVYDASGKRLTSAPETTVLLSAQKDFELPGGDELYVRGEYNYTSVTYYEVSNSPLASRPAYSLYNAQIGYNLAGGHWQMALWGRNLADEQYVNYINPGTGITASVGVPRTFGVRLNYTY